MQAHYESTITISQEQEAPKEKVAEQPVKIKKQIMIPRGEELEKQSESSGVSGYSPIHN
jgi:hypothetical protein